MLATPCELMHWYGFPVIRKELVKVMIDDFGLNQNEAAEKMGITPAAVCYYLSGKRGRISIIDKEIIYEINISAKKILQQGNNLVPEEICRLCNIMRERGLLAFNIIKG